MKNKKYGRKWKLKKDGKLGQRLAFYIAGRNARLSEISKKIGVDKSTISLWCNGKSIPSAQNLVKIANFLMVNLNDLVKK